MKSLAYSSEKIRQHTGVTLIEVLITIVIMAFGLLAVVLMQTISLKSNFESSQRTTANYLVEDIISRIRSSPLGNIGGYAIPTNNPIDDDNPASEPGQCTEGAPCSVANKIARDLWEWQQLLTGTSGLVNASGCIGITNNQIRVIVDWDGIGQSTATTNATACGTGDDDFNRRSLTIFTLH